MGTGTPVPEELRRAIIRAFHDEGLSYEEIAELLGIGEATVSRTLRLYRETGDVRPRPKGGGNRSPIAGGVADELRALVRATPDATLPELMEALVSRTGVQTSLSGIKRAMHRLGFSRKQRSLSRPSGTGRKTSSGGSRSQRC